MGLAMYPEFEQWLSVRVSPARQALLMDGFECLSELLDLRVWDSATNAMSLSERLDIDTCLTDLSQELREYCISAALTYGITLNEDLYDLEAQSVINKLLMTLMQVDAWEDGSRILAICQSDESNEEILAALCEEITGLDAETLLPLLHHVESDKITLLQELYEAKTQPYPEPVPDWHLTVLQYAKANQDLTVAKWLLEDHTIGLEFKQYAEFHVAALSENRSVDAHAKNWILMAMASGTLGAEEIYTQCVAYFDTVYQNLDVQSKVAKAIKTELSKFV